MTIAIVTDSTADIPAPFVEGKNITVVPAILVINGNSLEDGRGITREEFYTRLPTMQTPPTTATPSVGTFEQIYKRLLISGYEWIISIHISSLLSGIYNTAKIAAQSFKDRVKVIDSGQLSLGIGFQVLAAADAATNGLSLDAILQEIEQIRRRIRVVAMLDTLEYVRRSGRVSWVKARIGNFLNIKSFLEVKEGKVLDLGQVRTRRKGINGLLEILLQSGGIEKYAILHTNAEKDARELLSRINLHIPEPPLIVNVTTIVGTHIGPNALGFASVQK